MNDQITVGGTNFFRSDLENFTREQLRALARQAHTERNSSVSRTWLGSAAQSADLIAFIMENKPDKEFGFIQSVPGMPSPTEPAKPTSSASPNGTMEAAAIASLSAAIANFLPKQAIDRNEVETIVSEKTQTIKSEVFDFVMESVNGVADALSKQIKDSARVVRFEVGESRSIELTGLRHEAFDDLLADILAFQLTGQTAKANFFLVGPAGTGKTTAAEKIAEHLGLPFHFNGAIDSEYKLSGFIDAHGRIVYTPFRKAYSQGGVYLFDEVDSSLPSACLAFNAALANGAYAFPGEDSLTPRSPNCIIIASGNTWFGPDGNYVGRFRQDAAFLDRFVRVPWPIDEKFEASLCANKDWVKFVQGRRARAKIDGVEHLISPRASLSGDVLLAAGRPWNRVVELCVRKGLNEADWTKICRD
jgi:AAA domain (dynein-related subfamily)